jgi:putative MATE family efflux protein
MTRAPAADDAASSSLRPFPPGELPPSPAVAARVVPAQPVAPVPAEHPASLPAIRQHSIGPERLWRTLVLLALPILAENVLHMLVGLTDTWLAGHLGPAEAAPATAAVGTVAYFLWFVNLIASAIATGATAIIARAVGAKHRSLANSVCGQAIGAAVLVGAVTAAAFALAAEPLATLTGLQGPAFEYTRYYFQILSLSLPFSMATVAAAACLRGAGDTLSPAIAMVVVDIVNIALSWALTQGAFGLPHMGFRGIAVGTVVAYTIGGVILVVVLMRGKRIRLHAHRLRPHWNTLRRLLAIGLPSGVEGIVTWPAQLMILRIVNSLDATNVSGAAHIIAIRTESLSFMPGLALMTATATLVGQSLGRKDPARAARATWIGFGLGVSVMVAWGAAFALAGRSLASVMTNDPRAIDLAATCLSITAFAQVGFAATLVFGGALRGAGDTLAVMLIGIASQVGVRLTAVLVLTKGFGLGLPAVWCALTGELTLRGLVIFLRFAHGGWKHVKV